jgi:hypothetical protein
VKKYLVAAAVAASLFGIGIGTPAYASTPAVSFSKIYVNSPGSDTRGNASLNAEWVRLTNNTKSTVQLKGWTVRDKSNHVFTVKASFSLKAGKLVYIHTGRGTNNATNLYWGSGNYIWNNTGDTATLKNAAGKTIDTCKFGSTGSYTMC